ncbi:tetratricopeptide repeat protein [bacterium]|nr:tetratricopeptide repeat protein [bacterium]
MDDSNTATKPRVPGASWAAGWRWVPLLIVVAVGAAYLNSFHGPFLFDDEASIERNPAIRRLWPLTDAMSSATPTLMGRPVASLSLALNYAVGGLEVTGYRVVNVLLHAINALLVWGVLRRVGPPGGPRTAQRAVPTWPIDPGRRYLSEGLAAAVALLWALHPLATECVTYVVQRTELLMGCFLLLTVYASLRSLDAVAPRGWQALAVAACLLGAGSKEVMAVVPLLVLVYDWRYGRSAARPGAWPRPWFYAGLFASWAVLAVLLATTGFAWKTSLEQVALGPWDYAKTQATVVVHYLRLCFWPEPLVLDYYGWPSAPPLRAVLPHGLLLLGLLAATGWALARRHWLGFWGAWFFLILAPTSSFLPLPSEPAAERRMYLPLVAVLVVAVSGVIWLGRWLAQRLAIGGWRQWAGPVLVLVLAGTELVLTVQRNREYGSAVSIWSATVRDWPHSFRAFNNLGVSLLRADRIAEAGPPLNQARRLGGNEPTVLCNLAELAARQGDTNRAVVILQTAIRVDPGHADAHRRLAEVRLQQGAKREAMAHFQWALRLNPQEAATHRGLARLWEEAGDVDQALDHYRTAMTLAPRDAAAFYNAANLCAARGRVADAEMLYREARRRRPDDARIHTNLGNLLWRSSRPGEAINEYQVAVRLDPDLFEAQNNLAVALAEQERWSEAIVHLEGAMRLRPDLAELPVQLAEWQDRAGHPSD